MPEINAASDVVTVIVTVDAAVGVMPVLQEHARIGIDRFPQYRGFVGGALHVSSDGSRLVQYLQWTSEEDYRACMSDAAWDDLPSARSFSDVVESGEARVDVRLYGVVASAEGRGRP